MSKSNHNEENQISGGSTPARDDKKQYCAPALTILGSVNDITRGVHTSPVSDVGGLSD